MPDPIYVIPDIHGQAELLDQALALVEAHAGSTARIVFLGDLVDRGPDSRGVVQCLMDGVRAGRNWIVLRGNHDQVFVDFVKGEPYLEPFASGHGWLSDNMGGTETLLSYGIDPDDVNGNWADALSAIPQAHVEFLNARPFSLETEELFFVHAGIRPGVALHQQDPEEMIWMREPFLSDTRDHGKLIVHGHTPVEHPQHAGNRVNLDGGAAWGGPLHVAVFEGRDAWLLSGAGRTELLPCMQLFS